MKKILAILLVVAVVIFLSACGNMENKKSEVSGFKDEFALNKGDVSVNNSNLNEEESTELPPEPIYTISDEVLADNEYVTVTVAEAYEKGNGDFVLKFLIENKTVDTVGLYCLFPSCNGYMIESNWDLKLASGKTARSMMTFFREDLEMAGIDVVDEVEFWIVAYSEEDGTGYMDDYFSVYPTGLDASTVTYPEKTPAKDELVIFDSGDLKISIENVDDDGESGYTLYMFGENRSDKDIYIYTYSGAVNGYMMNLDWFETILSGKRIANRAVISKHDLDLSGIKKVEEIEFGMSAYEDGEDGKTLFDEIFVFNPENTA